MFFKVKFPSNLSDFNDEGIVVENRVGLAKGLRLDLLYLLILQNTNRAESILKPIICLSQLLVLGGDFIFQLARVCVCVRERQRVCVWRSR